MFWGRFGDVLGMFWGCGGVLVVVLTAISLQGLDVAGGAADLGCCGRDGAVLAPHVGDIGEGHEVEAVVGAQGAQDGLHGRLGLRAQGELRRGHVEKWGLRGAPRVATCLILVPAMEPLTSMRKMMSLGMGGSPLGAKKWTKYPSWS